MNEADLKVSKQLFTGPSAVGDELNRVGAVWTGSSPFPQLSRR
jgi:hypothetical protein